MHDANFIWDTATGHFNPLYETVVESDNCIWFMAP